MLLLTNNEVRLLGVEGWWQRQQAKGVLASCTAHELVGSQPLIPLIPSHVLW